MVSDLLRESMAAHDRAKALRNSFSRTPETRAKAFAELVKARDLREQALAADPKRTDPAWDDEQKRTPTGHDTHEALMTFYQQQLGDR
jgi:hypothetical protein